jgi:hypothetical protein
MTFLLFVIVFIPARMQKWWKNDSLAPVKLDIIFVV